MASGKTDEFSPPRPFFLGNTSSNPPTNSATTPRRRSMQRYTQVDDGGSDSPLGTPQRSPTPSSGIFQPAARPPPSSFAFPFQAYPGNPDPGLSIPGYSSSRRRSSLDSLSYRGLSPESPAIAPPPPPPLPNQSSSTILATSLSRRRAASMSDDLPPPNAPFMSDTGHGGSPSGTNSGTSSEVNSLRHSPSSNSLYKGSAAAAASGSGGSLPRNSSTHSFRTPFLSPASRPTSWAPPAYPHAQFMPSNTFIVAGDTSTGLGSSPSVTALPLGTPMPRSKPPQPSTRLVQPLTSTDKPWMSVRQPGVLPSYLLTLLFIIVGLGCAAILCFFGYNEIFLLDESNLCQVMNENFGGSDLNSDYWNVEVQTGGFGNGEFQMTSRDPENLFIRNGQLYIQPTLSTDRGIDINAGEYELEDCTFSDQSISSYVGPSYGSLRSSAACSATGNSLVGSVVPPAISARINTKGKRAIRYGKVEVRAKVPRGDWLWPAIWMLPQDNKYGVWPLSGEIDILKREGNGPEYPAQGSNYIRSSLNYGPMASLYTQLYGWQSTKRSSYDKGALPHLHLEWTRDFIRMSVDKRTIAMLEVNKLSTPKKSWSVVKNIWEEAEGGLDAPFDQPFYLIINLAVGGTSGWFPDGQGDKPWYDESQTAMRDFANAQDTWSKTWGGRDERSFRM
ncbi:glucan 1,3-beta-glucosidase [Coprinopsis sp. MPI-PUGE-AT-0042]|nr:glucan 1,3-beta-glucosidase [Coprinopsis sp. MPI-PUGE-AT-0042]